MTDQEQEEIKQKYTQLLADCQAKLDGISTIATTAVQKETEINALNEKIGELKTLLETNSGSTSTLVKEAENLKTQIDGHLQKINELVGSITTKQQELDNHYNGFLNKPSETEPSKLEKVNTTYQKIIDNADLADKTIAKLKELEVSVIGNKESKIPGIKEIFDEHDSDIKKKKAEWEERYNTLLQKIEGLLPGATSTGLASAYQIQGKKYQWPYWIWSGIFLFATGCMITFAINTIHDSESISDAIIRIISRIPFFVPAIWLAVFASKQQSQNRRLQEEYAYKETLSKSYESYKREIEKLPETPEKTKILENLIDAMVKMARDNPSHTLQMRHHNDRPPLIWEFFNRGKGNNNEGNKSNPTGG